MCLCLSDTQAELCRGGAGAVAVRPVHVCALSDHGRACLAGAAGAGSPAVRYRTHTTTETNNRQEALLKGA